MKAFLLIFIYSIFTFQLANAQMFWNQTARFNGTGLTYSYVSVPNSSSINITGSFTAEVWINPTSYATLSRGIIAKGGLFGTFLRYGIRITTAGRLTINTNGSQRLISRLSNPVPLNQWTHISANYNSSTNEFKIYFNGVLDTSSIIAGAVPLTNTDSLFVGISGGSTHFNGQIDEVRLWNRELSSSEVSLYMRTSLCTSSGIYNGLVLSMPFQKESSDGTRFTVRDFSGNENNGNPRNVTAVDQSYRPLQTLSQNDNIELDGDEDYLAGKDTNALNPADEIAIECWVYPRAVQTCNLITKGNQYALLLENNTVKAIINGTPAVSNRTIPVNQWSKITIQYNGDLSFHIDGVRTNQSFPFLGSLTAGTDSIYIGGVPGATGDFNGYMDEVRIFNNKFSDDTVFMATYKSIDKSNAPFSVNTICYNLDGALNDNAEGVGPKLNFRGNAQFSHPGGSSSYKPVSPLNRDALNTVTRGFYLGSENLKIPSSAGSSGTTSNLIKINLNEIINDVDVFIALNHTNLSSLNITLAAPNGDSVRLAENLSTSTSDNSLVTVFDDQADSSFASNKYVSFHTIIKPKNNMNSVFAGDNALGTWRLRITDLASGDTGVLSSCGIKINNMTVIENNFSLHNFIQGFYNPATNFTIRDTVTMYLRESVSPYVKADSSVRQFDQFGESYMSFRNVVEGKQYYVQVNHRNSIETWSSSIIIFKYFRSTRTFYLLDIAAYGNNEIQVDTSPVRFALYGGDVNQDDIIDLADLSQIDNDAFNFTTGYIVTDLNGDDFADLTDLTIADNNAFNFVSAITP